MTVIMRVIVAFFSLLLSVESVPAADLQQELHHYFSGSAIQFGYGSGISSNKPRVEMTIHYCSSGHYYSSGQSCRPNLIATGYQCTSLQDSGRWQLAVMGGRAVMQWHSNSSGPGSLEIFVRGNGLVVDQQGNPFYRVGVAQCR